MSPARPASTVTRPCRVHTPASRTLPTPGGRNVSRRTSGESQARQRQKTIKDAPGGPGLGSAGGGIVLREGGFGPAVAGEKPGEAKIRLKARGFQEGLGQPGGVLELPSLAALAIQLLGPSWARP